MTSTHPSKYPPRSATGGVKQSDAAYLAGLLDGEGYFKPKDRGQLRVGMTDLAPLVWAYERFGGTVNGPYAPQPHANRIRWEWSLTPARGLRRALVAILPFLIVKQKQAGLMLNLLETAPGPERDQLHRAITEAK